MKRKIREHEFQAAMAAANFLFGGDAPASHAQPNSEVTVIQADKTRTEFTTDVTSKPHRISKAATVIAMARSSSSVEAVTFLLAGDFYFHDGALSGGEMYTASSAAPPTLDQCLYDFVVLEVTEID